MTVKQIRAVCDAVPFQRFVIFLADGRSFPIQHPEFLSYSERSRMVIAHEVDGSWEIIDPQLVTSLRIPGAQGTD